MNIRKLNDFDLTDINRLFFDSLFYDDFYVNMYPNDNNRKKVFDREFSVIIGECLNMNGGIGVFEDEKLIAFIIFFDYNRVKNEKHNLYDRIFGKDRDSAEIRSIQQNVDVIYGNIVYLLSICVDEKYRKKGYATKLIDVLIESYPNRVIVSDISNYNSLGMYKKYNFEIKEIVEGKYYFVKYKPEHRMNELFNSDSNKLIVPKTYFKNKYSSNSNILYKEVKISGYKDEDNLFIKSYGAECHCYLVDIDYYELLKYQRDINLAIANESSCLATNKQNEKEEGIIYYRKYTPETESLYKDNLLINKISCSKDEWAIVPDLYVSIPIEYEDKSLLHISSYDSMMNMLLNGLAYRTEVESGIPFNRIYKKKESCVSIKERVERLYLGKLPIVIFEELSRDNCFDNIGRDLEVDLYLSIDKESNIGVINIVSMSCPFLVSHIMDNVIRNQITVVNREDESTIEFYKFLNDKYKIYKVGTPKIYLSIFDKKDCLDKKKIASLLFSETIYNDYDNMGKVVDSELYNILSNENGLGQYDRATVYAYSNVFIQFNNFLKGSITCRINEEVVTLYYIELLLLEEAAIEIADRNIVNCLSSINIISTSKFLKETLNIHKMYAKTIEFWDVQMNYPSSRKSIKIIRNAFGIEEKLKILERDTDILLSIFNTQRDILDRFESALLNVIILVLTIIQVIVAFSPTISEYRFKYLYIIFIFCFALISLYTIKKIYRKIK